MSAFAPDTPVGRIVAERSAASRLEQLAEKVAHVHGTQAPWIASVKEVFDELKPEMEAHIEKEEEIVFPFIRAQASGTSVPEPDALGGDPIALMEEEHDETGTALKRMRTLSHDFTVPEWGCNSFRALLDGLGELATDTHTPFTGRIAFSFRGRVPFSESGSPPTSASQSSATVLLLCSPACG